MDRDRLPEHPRVARGAGERPLAGRDELEELAEDASLVVLVVDAADDRAIPTVDEILQQVLPPLDADPPESSHGAGVARRHHHALRRLLARLDEAVAVALVDAEGLLLAHGLPPVDAGRSAAFFRASSQAASASRTACSASARAFFADSSRASAAVTSARVA